MEHWLNGNSACRNDRTFTRAFRRTQNCTSPRRAARNDVADAEEALQSTSDEAEGIDQTHAGAHSARDIRERPPIFVGTCCTDRIVLASQVRHDETSCAGTGRNPATQTEGPSRRTFGNSADRPVNVLADVPSVISEAPIKIREGNAHASPSKAPTVLLTAPSRPTTVIQKWWAFMRACATVKTISSATSD